MIGYKIAMNKYRSLFLIVKLKIHENAITNYYRTNIKNRESAKYRSNMATVIDIYDFYGNKHQEAHSIYNKDYFYQVGDFLTENNYDMKLTNVSTHGIHFFLHEIMARNYACNYKIPSDESGHIIMYYDDGTIMEEFNLINGSFQGKRIKYNEEGEALSVINYENGVEVNKN
jgi:antitoxin component YwqK of YwqJK toxin-antitoxin module